MALTEHAAACSPECGCLIRAVGVQACKEAEITEIVRGTEDDARTEMLEKGK